MEIKYNNDFDHERFSHQYLRPEPLGGLDCNTAHTHAHVLEIVRGAAPTGQGLLERRLLPVESPGQVDTDQTSSLTNVRILQWNILAQALSDGKDNFVLCPASVLSWDSRKLGIVEEILRFQPDVICLQEVDHYGFFEPVFQNVGYDGSFYPKPDSPAMYTQTSNGPDGCAMFYLRDRFTLLDHHKLILKDGDEYSNQVCILLKLQEKRSKKTIVVGTTHLKAKSSWHALRKRQGDYLIKYLETNFPAEAIVFCGDFNAEPTEEVISTFQQSSLNLKSSYRSESDCAPDEPCYTSWKFRGSSNPNEPIELCHSIDYIWYTFKFLKLKSLLSIPTKSEIGPKALPCCKYPSDHLALMGEFVL